MAVGALTLRGRCLLQLRRSGAVRPGSARPPRPVARCDCVGAAVRAARCAGASTLTGGRTEDWACATISGLIEIAA